MTTMIQPGMVFGGRYVIQSQIGTGGMATVYKGLDNVLDRPVAIKVMLSQYASDPAFATRFKQEAQAAAALQNPYIVQVYDWGHDDATQTYYIVMEYLRGTDLKSGIRSHGALAPRKVAQIGAQVCSALAVAHAHDIIHRDIKPQNIMIQPNGDCKVMDFGIARTPNSHLTQTNSVLGTAHYVSPEQAQGKPLGPTSDLYSLGVVMYEAATGRLPFDGDDAVAVALKQCNEQPILPSQINPAIDENLEMIILTCMQKDPARRIQTADQLRHILNNYITGRPLGLPVGSAQAMGSTKTSVMPMAGATQAMDGGARRMVRDNEAVRGGFKPAVNHPSRAEVRGNGGDKAKPVIIGIVAALAIALLGFFIINSLNGCDTKPADTTQTTGATSSTDSEATPTVSTAEVEVPDLSDLTRQQVVNKLESYGLVLGDVTTEQSDTVRVGKTISQTPAAKSEVAKGTKVDIVISSGSSKVTLPTTLLGQMPEAFENAIANLGLVAQHDPTLDCYSDTYAEGQVAVHEPANQQVAPGTVIKYGVSKGPESKTIPATTNASPSDAAATLTSLGFQVTQAQEFSDNVTEGLVTRTDPAAGTSAETGTTVTIYVSKGPDSFWLSDFTGTDSTSAATTLQAAGLTVSINKDFTTTDQSQVGQVMAQWPANTTVKRGDVIVLNVYGSYEPPAPTLISVPNVTGYEMSSAINTITGAGFLYAVVTEASDTCPANTVIRTDPAAGTSLQAGMCITIYQSTGPAATPTPDPGTGGGTDAG